MKKFLKVMSLVLVVAMLFAFAACGSKKKEGQQGAAGSAAIVAMDQLEADKKVTVPATIQPTAKENLKVGFIFLHDQNSTYDKNFMDAAKEACAALGLTDAQMIIRTGIDESDACYNTAKELIGEGCTLIFADSFGHEPYMIKAAKEFTNVQFCHATGTRGKIEQVPNYHTAFAEIYKGRYLAGVAAGLKLNEMIAAGKFTAEEAKIGYVGAFPYAEVISGYTSFFLGARSVCPTVTMEVQYTQSWFDIEKENSAAKALIASGCKLISQHADSSGAPSACEEAGVPNIAYNVDTSNVGPNTAIISSKISWVPYMKMIIGTMINGGTIPSDYCATLAEGAVELTAINNKAAAAGTAEKIAEVKAKLESGEIKVFDTETFTVGGKKLDTYLADCVDMGDFQPDTEVIINGEFAESVKRSAPYFDLIIDGITVPKA